MKKNKLFVLGMVVLALALVVLVVGCEAYDTTEDLSSSPPPAAPTGLTGVAVSSSSVDLSWNPVSGADYYRIEKRKAGDSSFSTAVFETVYTTNCTVTGLEAATTYYFHVAVISNYSQSDYSPAISVITNPISAPPAPSGISAMAVNDSSSAIRVTWVGVTVSDDYTPHYKVFYKAYNALDTSTNGLTEGSSYPTSATEYTVVNLNPFTEYIFYVKATSGNYSTPGIDGAFSTYDRETTNVAAPTNVTSTTVNNTTIKVTWDAVPGAASYKVYMREATLLDGLGVGAATLKTTVYTTEATITGLTNEKGYAFYVRASNNIGTATGDASDGTFKLFW